jgi:hypothetical protein
MDLDVKNLRSSIQLRDKVVISESDVQHGHLQSESTTLVGPCFSSSWSFLADVGPACLVTGICFGVWLCFLNHVVTHSGNQPLLLKPLLGTNASGFSCIQCILGMK